MTISNEEFQRDLRRVRSIATERVAMFDRQDNSFKSDLSNFLWAEYLTLRDKYGRDTVEGQALKAASDEVWED
jgi:hypothetical protein